MNAVVSKIESILHSEYSTAKFVDLVREVFPNVHLISPDKFNREFTNFSSHIEGSIHVGNFQTPDDKKIIIMSVQLKKAGYVENSRSTQRSYAKKLIENGNADAAFIAFYTEGEPKWRLSLVRLDYEMKIENGRLKTAENLTPAKRYSYLVGENEPCHTAISRFQRFITDSNANPEHPTLDDLEEAFSVEKVTDEFFNLYCEKFHQLREQLESIEDFRIEAEQHNFTSAQFAKKLMGQIVFLYFLQKKGWLGVGAWPNTLTEKEYKNAFFARGAKSRELIPIVYRPVGDGTYHVSSAGLKLIGDEDEAILAQCVKGKPWGSGPHDFMRRLFNFAVQKNSNFYNDVLEPLFYDALNRNRGEQGYCPALHCRIPFLSGGLFEPIDGYDWEHNDFSIPNEVFSNADSKGREADGILDVFDRYNFTMCEDEPMEREVAIDPEMLGKVFENLLEVNDRKSKGAFYTPREIVHYMCQESLINYLVNVVADVEESDIRDFILYGDFMKDEDTTKDKRQGNGEMYISEKLYKIDSDGTVVVNKLLDIDEALKNVRVADPAVGSGAFPLGMLNEIVRARQNISAYFAITMKPYDIRMMYQLERSPYELKIKTIQNCIFAADIEPSAVDIAQLRLWLALVIDDEINPNAQTPLDGHKNPLPLPNLESNILCGNSLVDEFEGTRLIKESDLLGSTTYQVDFNSGRFDSIVRKLIEKQDELFRCDDTEKKQQLKKEIEDLRNMIILSQLEGCPDDKIDRYRATTHMASRPYLLWQLDFARVFREKGGFDIVIGNPPYIGFHNVPNKEYNKSHFKTADGKYDFYVLFIERAIQLASPCGFASYICPSYFYKRNYGKRTRELLLQNTSIRYIADFSDYQIFDAALTYTCIFGASKVVNPGNKIRVLNKTLSISNAYEIAQNSLSEPSWILEKADTNVIIEKVQSKSSHTFGQITESISQGIVTGNNDIYLIDDEVIEKLHLEEIFLHRAYKGKDVGNGKLHNGGYKVFYPYRINESGKTISISEDELRTTAPNIYEYLLSKKDILLSRDYFVKSSKAWFELWNPRKMQHFYRRKFVFSEIGLVNDFVLVDECFYTDSCCGAELKEQYKQYETFIHRYLNSRLATYVYKKISVPKANGYSIYKNAFLKTMPILLPPKQADFHSMSDSEFDAYIYNLVGLTTDEVKIVETAEYSQAK